MPSRTVRHPSRGLPPFLLLRNLGRRTSIRSKRASGNRNLASTWRHSIRGLRQKETIRVGANSPPGDLLPRRPIFNQDLFWDRLLVPFTMMTLRQFAEYSPSVPVTTAWYMADAAQALGKQELFTKQAAKAQGVARTRAHRK